MAKTLSVLNVSRGYSVRLNQARKAVEVCACAWVEPGVSIRDLTLRESIAARGEQAKLRESLPYAEVHGLTFEAPRGRDAATRASRLLAYEASLFVDHFVAGGVTA